MPAHALPRHLRRRQSRVASAHGRGSQRGRLAGAARRRDRSHDRRRGGADAARPRHARPAARGRARARRARRRASRCAPSCPPRRSRPPRPSARRSPRPPAALAAARRALAAGVAGWARLAGAGTHPFAEPEGALIDDPKYAELDRGVPLGAAAPARVRPPRPRRGARRRPRARGPQRAALLPPRRRGAGRQRAAARRPRHRPRLAAARSSPSLLPRQGVPPAYASWEERADYERWGRARRRLPRRRASRGTSCASTTSTARSSCACPTPRAPPRRRPACSRSAPRSIAWLAERHDAGEPLPVHDHARIAENRWRAMRHGLAGTLLDLDSGEPQPARERVLALIDARRPRRRAARRRRASSTHARTLAARNGAERQRAIAAEHGPRGVVALAGRRVPAMRANVGARTSDVRRYVERRANRGGSQAVTLAKEPLAPARGLPRGRPAGSTRRSTTTARSARLARRAARARGPRPRGARGRRRARTVADEGVVFHSAGGDEVFVIDPVPRVIDAQRVGARRGRPRAARARAQRASSPTSTASGGSSTRASCPRA